MKIIPPYQITSEILNVINEANEYIVLVSPYVNFTNWERIKIDLKNALKRKVRILFYTRLDSENFKSWEQVEQLGIKPDLIKNLHSKLYFNEKFGIVTSMNLLTSSNLSAIEFGTLVDKVEDLDELKKYVKKYLEPNVIDERPNNDDLYLSKEKFRIVVQNYLSNFIKSNVYCKSENGGLSFNAKNQFYISIEKVKNNFCISSIISGKEAENFKMFNSKNSFNNNEIFLNIGEEGYYSSINYNSIKHYSNSNFDFLITYEKKEILEITLNFVLEVLEFKNETFEKNKACT